MAPLPNKNARLADSTLESLRRAPMQAAKEVIDNLKEAGQEKGEFLITGKAKR
jgi:hypothetical protein